MKHFKEHGAAYITAIATIAVLLVLGVFFQPPSSGLATRQLPAGAYLELIQNESHEVDVTQLTEFEIRVDPSGPLQNSAYYIETTLNPDSSLTYSLYAGDNNRGDPLAVGRMNELVASTGGIYLDDDDIPDLELRFANNLLALYNLRFVPPSNSEITFIVENLNANTRTEIGEIVTVLANEPYILTAQSHTETNDATISLSVNLPGFTDSSTTSGADPDGGTNKTQILSWTPRTPGPVPITVTSIVGGQPTTKEYVLAVDGLIYNNNNVKITLNDPQTLAGNVEITFAQSNQLQPFSLPCAGQIQLTTYEAEDEAEGGDPFLSNQQLYAFDASKQFPKSYKPGVPSEFYFADPLEGHFIKVNEDGETFTLTTACNFNKQLPSLHLGWNFIGPISYKPMSTSELNTKLPPGTLITEVKHARSGADTSQVVDASTLEPGSAYWVNVE